MTELFLERKLEVEVDGITKLSDVLEEILKGTGWSYDVSYKLYGKVRNVFISDRTHTIGKALEELSDVFGATLNLDFKEKMVGYEISEKENSNNNFEEVLYVFDKNLLQHVTELSKEKLIEEGLTKYKDELESVMSKILYSAKKGESSCACEIRYEHVARFVEGYLTSKGFNVYVKKDYETNVIADTVKYVRLEINWK